MKPMRFRRKKKLIDSGCGAAEKVTLEGDKWGSDHLPVRVNELFVNRFGPKLHLYKLKVAMNENATGGIVFDTDCW